MSRKFFNRYNHVNPVSPAGGKSMTDPQYKRESDINELVRKAGLGLPVTTRVGSYGDYSQIPDFPELMNVVERAKADFNALPSALRERFGNDPHAFVAFTLDPANVEECIRLGLRERVVHEDSALDVLKRIENVVTPKEEQSKA